MEWYVEEQSRYERHQIALDTILYEGKTQYQDVRLAHSRVYGKMLFLDGDIQSAQYDEDVYHQVLVHPALIACAQPPRRVLIMGGGEGATLREILRYPTIERVVMVDLDGELVDLCKERMAEWHQGAFDDPRLELLHEDARAWVDATGERFDAVIHDLPQPLGESPLRMLFSEQCFQSVSRALAPGGVLCMQATNTKPAANRMHMLIRRTVEKVFRHVLTLKAFIPSFATEWGYVVASNDVDLGSLGGEDIDRRIRERTGQTLDYFNGDLVAAYRSMSRPFLRDLEAVTETVSDDRPLPSLEVL